MRINREDPSWTAPHSVPEPRDDIVLLATAWLSEFADAKTWRQRLASTRDHFQAAKSRWMNGEMAPLYDPTDRAAWYVFQGNAYANDRMNWVPEEAVRIVPILTRIGTELERLIAIPGSEARTSRLMNADRSQPDGGLFELLVAIAYSRNGWDTEFARERPGVGRMHDINVKKGRRSWAVECKRMDRSGYEARERVRGENLARPVHDLALDASRSIFMQVAFDAELDALPDDYLSRRAFAYLRGSGSDYWSDGEGMGIIREIDWSLTHKVLAVDDVYYGSSRMIELLVGYYNHEFAHTMAAKWRPAHKRPFWAEAVYQASVVSWRNRSMTAIQKKARHFRSVVAKAAAQLPKNRPGVVHVGVESWGGGAVDAARHVFNLLEATDFDPGDSRLRWVYGTYFAPELTTRSDETWAVEETTISYRVSRHQTPEPLPHHMLLTPEAKINEGVHWDPDSQRPLIRQSF